MEGTPFGRYRLIELLGRGGMGEVWRAYDTGTDRIVALKLLPAHLAEDPSFEQRFRREAHSAARLNNAHIVPIHDYGEIDGRLYVDMALIDGHDLAGEIAAGPLDPARAVTIIEHIAGALQAAHRAGLVHRDVKPSNILLDVDDNAYLIDFGIARAATDSALTGTGNTLGTVNYMAPERFTSDDIDHRSDIYALTCVLYEALTGTRTFPGDTLQRQIAGHINTPPPQPSAVGLSPAFDTVIATGLAKEPEQRYQNAKDLATAARNALAAPAQPSTQAVEQPAPLPEQAIAAAPTTVIAEPPVSAWQGPPTQHIAKPVGEPAPSPAAAEPPAPAGPQPPKKSRRKLPLLGAAAAVVLLVVGIATAVNETSHKPGSYGEQVALPFTGLRRPSGVVVDAGGNVFVTDFANRRVLELDAVTNSQIEIPLNERFSSPFGIALDATRSTAIIVTDPGNNRVVEIEADTHRQSDLPFTGFADPEGVAVDGSGNIYVVNAGTSKAVRLDRGASIPTELDFTGLSVPGGVAVDTNGNV